MKFKKLDSAAGSAVAAQSYESLKSLYAVGDRAMTDAAELVKLADCPFCGGAVQFRKALWPSDGNVDAVIHAAPTECGLVDFSDGTTDESILATWNTRAAQQDGAWQPIATAPKDGTPIEACNTRHPSQPPVIVRRLDYHWCDAATPSGDALYFNENYFDLWKPCTPVPQKSGAEQT